MKLQSMIRIYIYIDVYIDVYRHERIAWNFYLDSIMD